MKSYYLRRYVLVLIPAMSWGAMKTETITYKVGDKTYKGFLAYDDASTEKRPGILVVHEFWGLNDYARERAEQLAGWATSPSRSTCTATASWPSIPRRRRAWPGSCARTASYGWPAPRRGSRSCAIIRSSMARNWPSIGYCFGGSTSLKLAHCRRRAGRRGQLPRRPCRCRPRRKPRQVKAKILICHGATGLFIKEETIQQVAPAYEKAGVDYELIYLGGAVHSFTVPEADSQDIKGVALQRRRRPPFVGGHGRCLMRRSRNRIAIESVPWSRSTEPAARQ